MLVYLGIRGWMNANKPLSPKYSSSRSIYIRAFLIATINVKSVAGYFAAFTQFVQPDAPIWGQMIFIIPTALTITAASYLTYTAIGAGLGRAAIGTILNVWVRRAMALCFIIYGIALGASNPGKV